MSAMGLMYIPKQWLPQFSDLSWVKPLRANPAYYVRLGNKFECKLSKFVQVRVILTGALYQIFITFKIY